MTKSDYEAVGSALRRSLPASGLRVRAYRQLVSSLGARNPQFDPDKFGASMGIPRLLRIEHNNHNTDER